jgi:hypothetical protein
VCLREITRVNAVTVSTWWVHLSSHFLAINYSYARGEQRQAR